MAKDDKFFAVVCWGALVLTGGIFLATNTSLPTRIGTGPEHPVAETPALPDLEEVVTAAVDEVFASQDYRPAVYEVEERGAAPATYQLASASLADAAFVTDMIEALSDGRFPESGEKALPGPDEVLVRRDSDGRLVVAAGTHRRYDDLRRKIEAVEAATALEVIEVLADLEGNSDPAQTLDRLLAVPVPDVEPDMVSRGFHWGFADEDYESLSTAEKHILFMGRRNARAVRSKLEEIRVGLGRTSVFEPDFGDTITESTVAAVEQPAASTAEALILPQY